MGTGGTQRGLPTTATGAEFGLVLAFVILRGFDLAQLATAVPGSLTESPRPGLDLVMIITFAGWSTFLCVRLVGLREFGDPRLVWADAAVGALVLLATPFFTQPADRFSSWAAWGYAVTLSVAVGVGVGIRSTRLMSLILFGYVVLYLAVTLPSASTSSEVLTTLTNSMAYPMFALVFRFPANYVRRLAADADAARATAARLAREAERDRHRILLHDQASVLTLLARPDTDPALTEVIRVQAATGARRVREFLSDEAVPDAGLASALAAAIGQFTDLDPSLNIDGVTTTPDPGVTSVLADAVTTLLHNVRMHAGAQHVVVYATTTSTSWEVQVSDDGAGFDPSTVSEGFGLTHQVRRPIAAIGGSVSIDSAPGEGTTVLLRGTTA